jgi:hypothetical protein
MKNDNQHCFIMLVIWSKNNWCYNDACDVILSVYLHRASLKNMPDHGGNQTYDLWNLDAIYLAQFCICVTYIADKTLLMFKSYNVFSLSSKLHSSTICLLVHSFCSLHFVHFSVLFSACSQYVHCFYECLFIELPVSLTLTIMSVYLHTYVTFLCLFEFSLVFFFIGLFVH